MAHLEHIGIAVDDVAAVVNCFDDVLDVRPYKHETVSAQQVRTYFLDARSAKLELLESLDDGSAVQRFLDRRGEGLHHLAFEVDDADAALQRLRQAGFSLLSDTPQPGADDKRIFFVHPKDTHGVLVEFCETVTPSWSPRLVPHRDGQLALYERGTQDRPTVLFLHGAAGCTRLDTAPLMRRLEPAFHVVGIDLSGHGQTGLPAEDELSIGHFVEDVHAAVDFLGESSLHLFGFSLGSAVALRFAHQYPGVVDHLALFSPNATWNRSLVGKMHTRLDLDELRENAPERAAALEAQHEHPERLFRALRAFVDTLPSINAAMQKTLSAVSHPTLVLGLDEDPLFSIDRIQAIHHPLPNARLSILPGSRHELTTEVNDLLAPLVRRHFSSE